MSFEFEQTGAMSVTAIKEGNVLRILSDSGDIPEHVPLRLSVSGFVRVLLPKSFRQFASGSFLAAHVLFRGWPTAS
jgi:hypothetical protein